MRVLIAIAAIALSAGWAAPSTACVGDCDADGAVAIAELITGVRISLGDTALDACPAFDAMPDGVLRIDELVRAVTALLIGCPVTLTPPSTATATPTPSPSQSATPSETPTITDTPTQTATPTVTPTVPAVSGLWREDPLAVVSSTCFPNLVSDFADELAARGPCTQQVTATSDTAVHVVDCSGTELDGTLERDGTIRIAEPTQSDTVEACTLTLDTRRTVPLATSPTTAQYSFQLSFSGACPLANCVIEAEGTWTLAAPVLE